MAYVKCTMHVSLCGVSGMPPGACHGMSRICDGKQSINIRVCVCVRACACARACVCVCVRACTAHACVLFLWQSMEHVIDLNTEQNEDGNCLVHVATACGECALDVRAVWLLCKMDACCHGWGGGGGFAGPGAGGLRMRAVPAFRAVKRTGRVGIACSISTCYVSCTRQNETNFIVTVGFTTKVDHQTTLKIGYIFTAIPVILWV